MAASLHADILRRSIRRSNTVDPQGFYKQAAAVIGPIWAATLRLGAHKVGACRRTEGASHICIGFARCDVVARDQFVGDG